MKEIRLDLQGGVFSTMTPAVVESVGEFTTPWGLYHVRYWRNETDVLEKYDNSDLKKAVEDLVQQRLLDPEKMVRYCIETVATAIINCGRINAVEVKHTRGEQEGVVIYPNWP